MLCIFSTPVLIRLLWQLKTVVFLHWCLMLYCVVLPKVTKTRRKAKAIVTVSHFHKKADRQAARQMDLLPYIRTEGQRD